MKALSPIKQEFAFELGSRRYIGSKSSLTSLITKAVPEDVNRGTFCDLFAGTGVVAASQISSFSTVVLNDFLYSNEIIYHGFFGKGTYSEQKIEEFRHDIVRRMSKPLKANYFSRNFGGKYFSEDAARQIGFVRDAIDATSPHFKARERAILISSLIYSCDRVANTVGHYEAYRRGVRDFRDFEFRLIRPKRIGNVRIFRRDANLLASQLKADVVYIDPPYNSRQYSRFYHVLETLTKWDKPKLSGVALKPPTENISAYCKVGAKNAFADLVGKLDAKLAIVSYNNTYNSRSTSSRNKISYDDLLDILKKRGPTQVISIPYKFFTAGNTHFDKHLEYLFVTRLDK